MGFQWHLRLPRGRWHLTSTVPFKSGPDNPTVQRALYVKQKREQRKNPKG